MLLRHDHGSDLCHYSGMRLQALRATRAAAQAAASARPSCDADAPGS
jgi:hypothetical protein